MNHRGEAGMMPEPVPLLQLVQTPGLGSRTLSSLLDRLAAAELSIAEFVRLPSSAMVERYGLTDKVATAIHSTERPAQQLAELLGERHIRPILRGGAAYPSRLNEILGDRTPPVLFVAGSMDLLGRRGVGFCGARDASAAGLECTDRAARALAAHGLVIVSGHAAGVDETAHAATLQAGGHTALVLPEGILHFRPRAPIRSLLTEDNAVIISEFPPKLPWSVANAMQRNRTICGLVHALIVIEAGVTGGTWEAGKAALSLGVPLFVLAYENPAPSAEGNALLLKKGGKPLPCRQGEPPDLALLLKALELPRKVRSSVQPTLFD
jgi:DNA protecting protein DprA